MESATAPEPIDYYSSGTRCSALLWHPVTSPSGPAAPAVVLCHGFRGIKEWGLPAFAELFARAGFVALAIDYRGFGESDGEQGRLVPREQVADIRAALSWLEAQDFVDSAQLVLYGTSFGGGNVVQAAAEDERVSAVVCQVGLGDVRRRWAQVWEQLEPIVVEDRKQRAVTGVSRRIDPGGMLDNAQSNAAIAAAEARWPRISVSFPLEAVEAVFEFAPERVVDAISPRPILFLGARNDLAVPLAETESLFAAAREPKRMHVYDITHYDIYEHPHLDRAVGDSLSFLAEHGIGPATPAR
ncbi:alpha/beta hydrolase [Gryllotalpicola reticulitermitis]|uniref:Alpha/beta hydrolase n=1 Tax=Gryllotalpicola reticulitermitis TaxID=1184153 RepID=A0ABV8Q7X1_9MICO